MSDIDATEKKLIRFFARLLAQTLIAVLLVGLAFNVAVKRQSPPPPPASQVKED